MNAEQVERLIQRALEAELSEGAKILIISKLLASIKQAPDYNDDDEGW